MKSIKEIVVLGFTFCLFTVVSCAQDFSYIEADNVYGKFIEKPKDTDFVKIENYLPEGYVTNGTVDYTRYIQRAIDENPNVIFPSFPLKINDKGLSLRDSSNVFFSKNSALVLAPTNKERYQMLFLEDVKDVNIYNPTLIGDRKNHKGASGQWGMGIRIHDGSEINIYNPTIKDAWGDGIYITSYTKNKAHNIRIKYGLIDNARRNGISIISGREITIDSVQIANTNGHNPSSGIDIEPNKLTNEIRDIELRNIITFNNEKDGIQVRLTKLIDTVKHKNISIRIANHRDINSRLGLRFYKVKRGKRFIGEISVRDCEYLDTKLKMPIQIASQTEGLPKLTFRRINTDNMNKSEFEILMKRLVEKRPHFFYFED